jgi:membrane protein implicated in regulation of membrane protease activity
VLANGATAYVVMSAAAGAALAWALVAHARTGRIPALAIVVLVLATLVRAYRQVRRGRARGDAQMAAIDDSGSAPP